MNEKKCIKPAVFENEENISLTTPIIFDNRNGIEENQNLITPAIFVEKNELVPDETLMCKDDKIENVTLKLSGAEIEQSLVEDATKSRTLIKPAFIVKNPAEESVDIDETDVKKSKALQLSSIGLQLSSQNLVKVEKDKKKDKPTHYEGAKKLMRKVHMCNVEDGIYFFDGICYEFLASSKFDKFIYENLKEEAEIVGTASYVRGVRDALYTIGSLVKPVEYHPNLVAFRNGLLDMNTWCFGPPTPQIFINSYLNCTFDDNGSNDSPNFDKFLFDTFEGNDELIQRAWEIVGYVLTTDMDGKCFFVFQGVGDSGKSVLGNFISEFFDGENTASVDIFRLGDRFTMSTLVGKRLNASLDLPSGILKNQAISMVKMLTGGDMITAEIKNGKIFKFKNFCKLLFATNHKIRLAHKDEAFENRLVLLPFRHSVPKECQDKNLISKFRLEKDAIIKKALLAYTRLKANAYVFSGEEYAYMEDYGDASYDDSVSLFVQEKCSRTDFEKGTFTKVLYEAYCAFCDDEGLEVITTVEKFSHALKEVCGAHIRPSKWRDKNYGPNPLNGFKGIVLT